MATSEIVTAVVGAISGGGLLKLLDWYGSRKDASMQHEQSTEKEKLAAQQHAQEIYKNERATVVELLTNSAREAHERAKAAEISGEARAERSLERAVAITNALNAATEAHRETAQAINNFAQLVLAQNERIDQLIRTITGKPHD